MIRGGVYQVNLGPIHGADRGDEQRGKRYGILVSPSSSPLSVVTVVPTSSSAQAGVYHPEFDFDGRPTVALVEQTRAIDIRFVGEMVGFLTQQQMWEVDQSLTGYLGLVPQSS